MGMEATNGSGRNRRLAVICWAVILLAGCRAEVAPELADWDHPAPAADSGNADVPSNIERAGAEPENPIAAASDDRDAADGTQQKTSAAAVEAGSPARRARDKDKLLTITFDDLKVNIQADQLFEPWMATDRVRELDGQRVRIRGFIFPAIFQQTGIKSFPLVMNIDCKFGPGEQAHHVILVEMIDGASTSYTVRPIAVTGRLTLAPWTGPDGNTWALYHLAGERVD